MIINRHGTEKHIDKHMDIATPRLKQLLGWFSEKVCDPGVKVPSCRPSKGSAQKERWDCLECMQIIFFYKQNIKKNLVIIAYPNTSPNMIVSKSMWIQWIFREILSCKIFMQQNHFHSIQHYSAPYEEKKEKKKSASNNKKYMKIKQDLVSCLFLCW